MDIAISTDPLIPVERTLLSMDTAEIERIIESAIPDTEATVTTRSGMPDDDHYEAIVISPAFVDRSLVDQHKLVYDALGDHMTRDIHALDLTTRTPDEH